MPPATADAATAELTAARPAVDKIGAANPWLATGRALARRAGELLVLLFAISTLLFFLLRLSGDPAQVIAGEAATPAQVDSIRDRFGFNDHVVVQYGRFIARAATLDFGASISSGQPAMGLVLEVLPATAVLTVVAITANLAAAIPLGAWLGSRPDSRSRQATAALVFIAQGVPGYVVGLLAIQVFTVWLGWLPSIGNRGVSSWILPSLTLAAFLAPKLTRVLAANVAETMREDYIRTALANGASAPTVLWRHAVPNALLGAVAILGVQFSYLLSGAVVTEYIFAWPGAGRLLVNSVTTLDFPVVQAAVFVTAALVFIASIATEVLFRLVDPRLRRSGQR